MKPGFKTSEFWLLVGVNILGFIFVESGVCEDLTGGTLGSICGMGTYALGVLSAMGYVYTRYKLKVNGK